MGSSEKFCLRWNDFETNISVAFRELREEKDFFDVTLACDDSQVQAHKVILSACSPFFRSILRRNPHQHPLLYLKGVKYKELLSVLNFMYMGEVNVAQEELNSFLAVAEDLRVKGLTQNNAESSDKAKAEPSKASTNRAREPPDREAGAPPAKRPRPVAPSPITPVQQNNRQSNYKDDDDDIQEVVPVKSEPRDPSTPSTAMAPVETAAATSNEYQVDPGEGQVALDDQYQDDSYDYGEYAEGYDDGSGMIDPNTGMPMAGGADGNKVKPIRSGFEVFDDEVAMENIKQKSRSVYIKAWQQFKEFFGFKYDFEVGMPTEEDFMAYFDSLRTDQGKASSTMWTTYSMINTVCKSKYGRSIKEFPAVSNLLKSYDHDIKRKSAIFSREEVEEFINLENLSGPYWLVRKVVVIIAYFGGLSHSETMDLSIEKFDSATDGVFVVHERSNKPLKFLVPRARTVRHTDWAGIVESYLGQIREDIGKVAGRVFWTGRNNTFVNQPLGRNMLSYIPHEMAKSLNKVNYQSYTFHSLKRSATTVDASDPDNPVSIADFLIKKEVF